MKAWLTIAAVLVVPACSYAQAAQTPQASQTSQASQVAKPCEELKSEIAAKLDAKGVKAYSLEIVAKDQDAEGKAVGTCEGGTKKIIYRRTSASTAAQGPAKDQGAAKEPEKP